MRSAASAARICSIVAAGAHNPFENSLRPFFSTTAQDGPAAFTRRVSPASPGGKHAHPAGGVSNLPSGARNTRASAVGASVKEAAVEFAVAEGVEGKAIFRAA